MRFYSWNVNGLRAVIKKGEWQKFIDQHKPDIVGLQEIKAKADQIDLDNSDGYYKFYNSAEKPGYAGTAIFSKTEPIKVYFDIAPEIADEYELNDHKYGHANNEGRVLTAEYDHFYFVTVYTPNTKDDLSRLSLRQDWDKAFLKYIKFLERSKPVIFCGDLNVAHKEIDLANPKANVGKHGFTLEERTGFNNFIDNNLIDTFREFNNQPNQYTWWSHFAKSRERNVGWRIDYFLISNKLKNNLIGANIHPEQKGSDHCPVSIEIKL